MTNFSTKSFFNSTKFDNKVLVKKQQILIIELANFFILRQQLDKIFIANIEQKNKIENHLLSFFPCQINLCLGTYTVLNTKSWEAGTYYECACKQYLKILNQKKND